MSLPSSHPPPAPQPFAPYIPDGARLPEFTARAVIVGAILGIAFGISSLYLVLKVGLTVSASIPVAVISLAIFRALSKLGVRDASILEHNITQTAGSAGESIAFGVGVTMPAILILGFDLDCTRVLLVAVLGGLLGILMMIPLRRAHIVEDHATLKYPEGTACAAVLKAGASAADRAAASPAAQAEMRAADSAGLGRTLGATQIFAGFIIGFVYKTFYKALQLWQEAPEKVFGKPLAGASVSMEISPELLGVGYVIGPRISGIMCAGGALSYLVLIPLIKFFGGTLAEPLAPAQTLIRDMSPGEVRNAYVLYIGAGAVAAAGLISMARALPAIWRSIKAGLADFMPAKPGGLRGTGVPHMLQNDTAIHATASRAGRPCHANHMGGTLMPPEPTPRTQRDLPMRIVLIGILAIVAAITLVPSFHMNILGAILIIVFGFLFVTVSSRLTGEIGSSSNPISGMTVATLLFTCLIFLIIGWTGPHYYVTALSIGAIVCIASSNGGSTSQDLKTGFLLGSTPRSQQLAILAGAFASALILGPTLIWLNDAGTVYVPAGEVAPAGLRADASTFNPATARQETLGSPQSKADPATYYAWQKNDTLGGPAGKYLVNAAGAAVWYVDPAINGTHKTRPDGTRATKFDAPKATLISYIIKGILDQKLPWALVLLGVMITVTLELSFIPALAFAVGVYLPLSSTTPILVGGAIRWLIERWMRKKPAFATLTAGQFNAESDKSPGVLLCSGYIAGGAITGVLIAILYWLFPDADKTLTDWSTAHNPFFDGPYAGLLSLIPFALLAFFLYGAAREWFLAPRPAREKKPPR